MTALDRLNQITPPDIALANKALAVSMLQITGIASMNLPQFANTVSNVQTTYGLPLITDATSAVPPESANAITSKLAAGTGTNGTITISDAMGTIAGYVSANAMANTVAITSTMDLGNLSNIYIDMTATANGSYGDPTSGPITIPSGPANGVYDNIFSAFNGQSANSGNSNNAGGPGLIPATLSNVIPNIISVYPDQTANLNSNWSNMAVQINSEKSIQAQASVNFANLTPNSSSSIFGFVFSLPSYGQDTNVGGTAQFLEAVADKTTIGGQAIIATLRQGQSTLNSTGIKPSTNIPSTPSTPPEQANLLPAQPPYPPPITN
jgi:hypothetical protein